MGSRETGGGNVEFALQQERSRKQAGGGLEVGGIFYLFFNILFTKLRLLGSRS